jgi:hypothetical protein
MGRLAPISNEAALKLSWLSIELSGRKQWPMFAWRRAEGADGRVARERRELDDWAFAVAIETTIGRAFKWFWEWLWGWR